MLSDKSINTNGTQTVFSSDFPIISEDHLRVFLDDVVVSRDDYDLINNAAVFFTAPASGQALIVQVGTTPADILESPTNIGTVASNIDDITSVADNMATITNAATFAVNADESADAAADSASDAAGSASTASTDAGLAEGYKNSANTDAGLAEGYKNSANTDAGLAEGYRDTAEGYKNTASGAKDDAVAALESFEDVYLGSLTSDPSSTTTGSWYFNSDSGKCRIYNGSTWGFFTLEADNFVNQTSSTGAAELPAGDGSQRPANPPTGSLRWNTGTHKAEVYNGNVSDWENFAGDTNVQSDWTASQYLNDGITDNVQHILNKPDDSAITDVSGTPTLKTGITQAEVRTAIDAAEAGHAHTEVSTSADGFAPQLPGAHGGKFLKADGTWEVPPNDDTNTQLSDAEVVTAARTNSNIDALANATSPVFTDENTEYTAGAGIDVTSTTISLDIAGITSSSVATDSGYFATVPDSGTGLKKVAKGNIELSGFNNDLSMASSSNDGLMTKEFAASVDALVTNNLTADGSPGATDDTSNGGYDVGSTWVDITNDQAYICLDKTTNNAVWTEITSTGGGGGVSLPVSDATWIVKGNIDDTKQARFECDNLSTGGSVVMTVPTSNGTLSIEGHTHAYQPTEEGKGLSTNDFTTAQADAITANTAKVGITTTQASAIVANTAKTGITTTQADAITANTAKTGITTTQADAITANTAKVGITTAQASAIVANTSHSGSTHVSTTADQSWTGAQRSALFSDNDGSFDMDERNNFTCTPTGAISISFSNIAEGQSGFIYLDNSAGVTVSRPNTTLADNTSFGALSSAGKYLVSYLSVDTTNVAITSSVALTTS